MMKLMTYKYIIDDICNALRNRLHTSRKYKIEEVADAIEHIPDVALAPATFTANGVYDPESGVDGFCPVTVAVPNTYDESDNGKVVSNGMLVSQSSMSISTNGTFDTTEKNEITVNVSAGGSNSLAEIIERNILRIDDAEGSVTFIGMNAFASCRSLTEANFPSATSISAFAFANCTALTSVSFPFAKMIGTEAFSNCRSLTEASFPSVTAIGVRAFYQCSSLSEISFPVAFSIGESAFASCAALTTASFPSAIQIMDSAFFRCYNLVSLYLLGSSVCTLANSTPFNSTPIGGYSRSAGRYGSIFVPLSLYDQYISKAWWSLFSSRFVPVEMEM